MRFFIVIRSSPALMPERVQAQNIAFGPSGDMTLWNDANGREFVKGYAAGQWLTVEQEP